MIVRRKIYVVVMFMMIHQLTNAQTKGIDIIKLITLAPGHFHAAFVQKNMYADVDNTVHVYAPEGAELQAHLKLINQYNQRADKPTQWVEKIYTGNDYVEKMLQEKPGNVVVLAGNNQRKTDYIQQCIDAGLNVFGDKPMAININEFHQLEKAFTIAEKKHVLLYDIMTERSEITNTLQKEFANMPAVFGELQKGSADDPAVRMESVHFFYKYVSGNVLTRPDWFFDPTQQGDAITDVGVHLIDLIQWECFPGQAIDYTKDVEVLKAKIWPTALSLSQFSTITKEDQFPAFLKPYISNDTMLQTHANGEINYIIKGIHARVTPRWEYNAVEGGDTHYSLIKGTKASLEIKQSADEHYKPVLYIYPEKASAEFYNALQTAVHALQQKYPGVSVEPYAKGFRVIVPTVFDVGHEAHFAQVMNRFLEYLHQNKLPDWEVPCMLSKYYTATKGLELAESNHQQ